MSKQDDGGPAFPVHGGYEHDDPRNQILGGGMSLRDHFAGQALQSILMSEQSMAAAMRKARNSQGGNGVVDVILAAMAYTLADAMLKVREQ